MIELDPDQSQFTKRCTERAALGQGHMANNPTDEAEILDLIHRNRIAVWTHDFAAYVAAEAGLSYLGIGLTGVPSLGQTINEAISFFREYPLYLWAPVITVMVLVLALNLLGDSIRDAFDPKTRR